MSAATVRVLATCDFEESWDDADLGPIDSPEVHAIRCGFRAVKRLHLRDNGTNHEDDLNLCREHAHHIEADPDRDVYFTIVTTTAL